MFKLTKNTNIATRDTDDMYGDLASFPDPPAYTNIIIMWFILYASHFSVIKEWLECLHVSWNVWNEATVVGNLTGLIVNK